MLLRRLASTPKRLHQVWTQLLQVVARARPLAAGRPWCDLRTAPKATLAVQKRPRSGPGTRHERQRSMSYRPNTVRTVAHSGPDTTLRGAGRPPRILPLGGHLRPEADIILARDAKGRHPTATRYDTNRSHNHKSELARTKRSRQERKLISPSSSSSRDTASLRARRTGDLRTEGVRVGRYRRRHETTSVSPSPG